MDGFSGGATGSELLAGAFWDTDDAGIH